jgi:hypothetical protein
MFGELLLMCAQKGKKHITCTHLENKSDDEIYVLTYKSIATKPELHEYRDKEFCRVCKFMLSAMYNLDPNEDFLTKSEIKRRESEREKRMKAFSVITKWAESLNGGMGFIPDIDGKPPEEGGLPLCRVCGEPHAFDELYLIDKRIINWLEQKDLTENSTRPEIMLYGKALCKRHFDELYDLIMETARKNGINVGRWERGREYHMLGDIIRRPRRFQR